MVAPTVRRWSYTTFWDGLEFATNSHEIPYLQMTHNQPCPKDYCKRSVLSQGGAGDRSSDGGDFANRAALQTSTRKLRR
jgi:hypothetical protein